MSKQSYIEGVGIKVSKHAFLIVVQHLTAAVLVVGMVEQWVQKLVDGMQNTMKAVIKRAARDVNEMSLEDFLFSNPAQVALLGLQFQWTADTQV